jgi:hypothetical protein
MGSRSHTQPRTPAQHQRPRQPQQAPTTKLYKSSHCDQRRRSARRLAQPAHIGRWAASKLRIAGCRARASGARSPPVHMQPRSSASARREQRRATLLLRRSAPLSALVSVANDSQIESAPTTTKEERESCGTAVPSTGVSLFDYPELANAADVLSRWRTYETFAS